LKPDVSSISLASSTERPATHRDDGRLDEHHAEHGAVLEAERLQHAELSRPLADRHHHRVGRDEQDREHDREADRAARTAGCRTCSRSRPERLLCLGWRRRGGIHEHRVDRLGDVRRADRGRSARARTARSAPCPPMPFVQVFPVEVQHPSPIDFFFAA
jgi:hypothetical protein